MLQDTRQALVINGRFLLASQPTGTQRCSRRLVQALVPQLPDLKITIAGPSGIQDGDFAPAARPNVEPYFLRPGIQAHICEQFRFPLSFRKSIQLHLMGTAPFLFPARRQVMIVHDLNYKILRETFKPAFRLWYHFANAWAARQSTRVFCISHHVARTLVQWLGVDHEKIRVSHLGPGFEIPANQPVPEIGERRKTVLCVGSLQPHKNLKLILEAWRALHLEFPDWNLEVVGRPQGAFNSLGIGADLFQQPRVGFTGYLDDKSLMDRYLSASVFVFPSLEEGFGMPIVESFQLGCPVVTSNRSCLPEVAGEAACLVDVDRVESLVSAMRQLMASRELRAEYQRRGIHRGRSFDWNLTAKALADCIRELV